MPTGVVVVVVGPGVVVVVGSGAVVVAFGTVVVVVEPGDVVVVVEPGVVVVVVVVVVEVVVEVELVVVELVVVEVEVEVVVEATGPGAHEVPATAGCSPALASGEAELGALVASDGADSPRRLPAAVMEPSTAIRARCSARVGLISRAAAPRP